MLVIVTQIVVITNMSLRCDEVGADAHVFRRQGRAAAPRRPLHPQEHVAARRYHIVMAYPVMAAARRPLRPQEHVAFIMYIFLGARWCYPALAAARASEEIGAAPRAIPGNNYRGP